MAGFAALGMEVAWTRSLVWVIGADSYQQQLDRLFAGNQFLLLSHFFYLSSLQEEERGEREYLRSNMISAYQKAMELIPGNRYPLRIINQSR